MNGPCCIAVRPFLMGVIRRPNTATEYVFSINCVIYGNRYILSPHFPPARIFRPTFHNGNHKQNGH
jgi:hypothetical protein